MTIFDSVLSGYIKFILAFTDGIVVLILVFKADIFVRYSLLRARPGLTDPRGGLQNEEV